MSGHWHTDRKVGEIAVLPNGTRVRIASIRGRRVRIEYIDPRREGSTSSTAPSLGLLRQEGGCDDSR